MLWKLVENVKYEDIYEVSMERRGTLAGQRRFTEPGKSLEQAWRSREGKPERGPRRAGRSTPGVLALFACLVEGKRETGRRGVKQEGISEASFNRRLRSKEELLFSRFYFYFIFCFRFLLPLKK